MVLYGATKVLWTKATQLLPHITILQIDLQSAVSVKAINDFKLLQQNVKSP